MAITGIGGAAVVQPAQGWQDQAATAFPGTSPVDIIVNAPGLTSVEVTTSGVPEGTLVNVSAKPSNGVPLTDNVLIDAVNCDASGTCAAFADLDLAAGFYAVEAEATFQTPSE